MAYQAPEGFEPYQGTKYYYTEREGLDLNGNPARIITYFDTETGEFSEQSYPIEATQDAQPYNEQVNANTEVKKKSAMPLIITCSSIAVVLVASVLIVWLTGIYKMIPIFGDDASALPDDGGSSQVITPTGTPESSSDVISDGDYPIEWVDAYFEEAIREKLFSGEDETIMYNDVKDIVELDLIDCEIEYIDDIKHFTALEHLMLRDNYIEDIAPLAALENLKMLDLSDNFIEDVSPLSNMSNLISLYLENNYIEDVSPLANLTNLQALYLEYNMILDWSPVLYVEYLYGKPEPTPEPTPEPVQNVDISPGTYAFYDSEYAGGEYVVYIIVRPGYPTWFGATNGGTIYFDDFSMEIDGNTVVLNEPDVLSEAMMNMGISTPINLTYDGNFTITSQQGLWTLGEGAVSEYLMGEVETAEYYYYLYE